ncbi:MAG: argininosuccinate synthase [Vicinamibacterales bacterium]
MKNAERIVLGYSGGLQSSLAIAWLTETYGAEVVTVTLDLGQGDDLADLRARALGLGARRGHVLDVRDEFARDFLMPALKANALSEDRIPMATALGRPLIARKLIEVARIEDATTIGHGAIGRDRARIEGPLRSLDPLTPIVAAASEWDFTPQSLAAFADQHGITLPAESGQPFRADRNLWGRSVGVRGAIDPSQEVSEAYYAMTRRPDRCPDQPAYVDLGFERGLPATVNGVAMPIVELVDSLTTIGSEHGVGRLDRVKQKPDGTRSQAVYEMPASVVLHAAHLELDRFVHASALMRVSRSVAAEVADVVDRGEWFTPAREALGAFVDHVQQTTTGVVRLKLFKGDCRVVGRSTKPSEPL